MFKIRSVGLVHLVRGGNLSWERMLDNFYAWRAQKKLSIFRFLGIGLPVRVISRGNAYSIMGSEVRCGWMLDKFYTWRAHKKMSIFRFLGIGFPIRVIFHWECVSCADHRMVRGCSKREILI